MLGALLLTGVFYSLTNETFFTSVNLGQIALQASPVMLVALGMTVVIISGGIDLSVGAAAGFSSVVAVWLITNHVLPVPLAALAAVAAGASIGLLNGALVIGLRIPDFIATLATMTSLQGLSYVVSGGFTIRANNADLGLFAAQIGDTPFSVPIVIMIATTVLIFVILAHTPIGRNWYAVGGGRDVARLAGMQVGPVSISAYVACGVCAAIAGLIEAARTQAGSPVIGTGWELQAITIVVLGGANLFGGTGGPLGTILAGLLLASLDNWIALQAFPDWVGLLVRGATLIVVVAVVQSQLLHRRTVQRDATALGAQAVP